MRKLANIGMLALLALWLLSGCYHVERQPTDEEMLQAQVRVYQAKTPEQIQAATKRLFQLADKDDVHFAPTPRGVKVRRLTMGGTEAWEIETTPEHTGTKVYVSMEFRAEGVSLLARDAGPYALFFHRLDYLLGLSNTWMTCHDYEVQISENPTWGNDGYLCFLADDNLPEALRPTNTAEM